MLGNPLKTILTWPREVLGITLLWVCRSRMFRRKGEAGLGATRLNTSARLGSGKKVISVTIRPTRAKKLTRTASTGIRWRSPTPTGRRLDLPRPQLECRILGLSGLFRGPDPASSTDPVSLQVLWHRGVTWAWEQDFWLEFWYINTLMHYRHLFDIYIYTHIVLYI